MIQNIHYYKRNTLIVQMITGMRMMNMMEMKWINRKGQKMKMIQKRKSITIMKMEIMNNPMMMIMSIIIMKIYKIINKLTMLKLKIMKFRKNKCIKIKY